jgi:hypothetical protein
VVRVAIPGGVWREDAQPNDAPLRELALRAVSEEDAVFLLDTADSLLPSARATALLARCLGEPDAERTARALTVGDREALLLQLRRLSLGETLDCVLRCPAEACGERMELGLRVADMLVPSYQDVKRAYELAFDADEGGARYEISFRVPTAADLENVALIARGDPERGARALLADCLRNARRDGADIGADTLAPSVVAMIANAMVARDPQAEIELELACPACGEAFAVLFDTASFLLQELDERATQLMREVHTLAWHYHWSEREIFQMPRRRRARYLELIAEATREARAR